ncbi:MAG: molybdopterin-binding protein [Anaerolineae bacterium]|nr:molybdopterin-binding protein [Anaerolineae bacterium]MCI0609538.1 molybdopterin-binding protein [Anaerolineae bacterium]
MKFEPVPLSEAEGKILGHNIAGANGQRLLRKGKPLTEEDLGKLRALGRTSVYVAQMEEDDVDENKAARRVAEAVCGPGLHITGVASGRANLLADQQGILRIDVDRLVQINECNGITLTTLLTHSPVHARQIVATIKIIPYAVPESIVSVAEGIANGSRQIVRVDALPSKSVGMVLSGSNSLKQRLISDFAPLRDRIEKLGSTVTRTDFVALDDEEDETALAGMLNQQVSTGVRLILIAGETAIMDTHDIVPRAVERAGGTVESVGAPVDPGNLLMLAYINDVPVVGAPGCARSRKTNIVDWILPRLLVGDRLTRRDIVELGHGGLLQDVRERGMPRDVKEDDSDNNTEPESLTEVTSPSG